MANIIGTNANDTLNGTTDADTIDGRNGNDTIIGDYGKDTLIGGSGNDSLFSGGGENTLLIGGDGNDTLIGGIDSDSLIGGSGNDSLSGEGGNDTLTGGGGKDTFVYNSSYDDISIITDFGGVGKGTNPTAGVIAEVDTIKFSGSDLTARNLLLTQNGANLEITFEQGFGWRYTKVILQNFKLEDLDNLKASGSRPAIGNILFDGETTIVDSFNVLDANSTDTSIGIKNTVTFLNDLDNNITGLDNSNDTIDGQGGNDLINGLSGDDLLRGGLGNNTLIGGAGNDTLHASGYYAEFEGFKYYYVSGNNSLIGGVGDDYLSVNFSTGNNTLNGGAGDDTLYALGSKGNNLLFGGDGKDILNASFFTIFGESELTGSSGNNTLKGGAGDDTLLAESPEGNKFLYGEDGNDYLSSSGIDSYRSYYSFSSPGNNILNGGSGNDTLLAEYSTGNNLLSGGDDNDYLSVSGYVIPTSSIDIYDPTSGNNTLNGGAGNDTLRAEISTGSNLLSGGDGNDSFYVSPSFGETSSSYLETQTIDGGIGDDFLSVDYRNATGGIKTTFNATTNIGEMTGGKYRVSYKNIEQLNIADTAYDDNIVGSNGNDTLSVGKGGKDTIDGGKGDDLLSVNYNYSYYDVYPTAGITSTFNATTNTGSITGSITAGTYRVSYKNIERLNIAGTEYNDNIVGSNGNDALSTGFGGKDTIDGGKGNDLLSVNYGYYTAGITSTYNATTNTGSITTGTNQVSYKNIERLDIAGTGYNDKIVGSNGNDTLSTGFSGNDTIIGGAGNDSLIADSDGNNTLNGAAGDDILTGGRGNNSLYGGAGIDTFAFNTYTEGSDRIYDFNATNEVIQVSAVNFGGGLSPGVLKASQFTIGTSANTSTQRFIYNSTSGALFFDQDGSGNESIKVQFAQLSAGLLLTNNNFVIV